VRGVGGVRGGYEGCVVLCCEGGLFGGGARRMRREGRRDQAKRGSSGYGYRYRYGQSLCIDG